MKIEQILEYFQLVVHIEILGFISILIKKIVWLIVINVSKLTIIVSGLTNLKMSYFDVLNIVYIIKSY